MEILDTFLDAMGGTPLVRLNKVTRGIGATVVAKLEMLNPGGSVKDRIGLRMIEAAERAGALKPGGTIVEPTSGNTGHGLAIAAAIRGYRCIFVMPDKMSQEKISLLRAYGAEVVIAPTAVPPESPESYYRVADRLTEEIPGAFQPNQYYNEENPAAHEATTGPEIWRQTDGRITAFVCGVGTGGTITGVARYLKAQKPDLLVVGADPEGSIYSGDAHPYLTEGIGEDFWPTTFDPSLVDRYVRVSDRDAFSMARRITREEGILVGGSSGTAVVAALEVARELGPDDLVVVILPDTGRNYLSKLYSDSWLLQYGLTDRPEVVRVEEVFQTKGGDIPPVVTVNAHDKVRQAIDVLQEYSISQAPVVREASSSEAVGRQKASSSEAVGRQRASSTDAVGRERDPNDISGFVGSIRENALLDRIFRDPDALQADVAEVMGPPIGMVEFDAPIEVAFEALQTGPALLVVKGGQALGVLTRSDLLEFLAHRRA